MSAPDSSYTEFNDRAYTQLRRNLLRFKGGDQQREFLMIVRDNATFPEYFDKVPKTGHVEASLAPCPMTESEYKEPPSDTEHALYTAWSTLTPSIACRSTFWANLTLAHIMEDRIQSVYLAANGGTVATGAERIDIALTDKTALGPQRIDACVRTVLRRLGGLPEVRGNRSVYVDCPFARAWWREHIVAQASGGDEQLACQVRLLVRIHQTYWEKLIDRIVFRNSTFGSTNIRSALLRMLGQFLQANPKSDLSSYQSFQRLCRRATAYQGSRELSVLSDRELDALMEDVVRGAA